MKVHDDQQYLEHGGLANGIYDCWTASRVGDCWTEELRTALRVCDCWMEE